MTLSMDTIVNAIRATHWMETCVPDVCVLPDMPNAELAVDHLVFPHTLIVECSPGHSTGVPPGNYFGIGCAAGGTTTYNGGNVLPQCSPVSCGQPPSVMAEEVDVREYFYGESSVS